MGFRFRKSTKILPGVRLNFSKGGVSASVGPRGASVSVGKQGVHANVGIPGTGISYREKIGGGSRRGGDSEPFQAGLGTAAVLCILVIAFLFWLL